MQGVSPYVISSTIDDEKNFNSFETFKLINTQSDPISFLGTKTYEKKTVFSVKKNKNKAKRRAALCVFFVLMIMYCFLIGKFIANYNQTCMLKEQIRTSQMVAKNGENAKKTTLMEAFAQLWSKKQSFNGNADNAEYISAESSTGMLQSSQTNSVFVTLDERDQIMHTMKTSASSVDTSSLPPELKPIIDSFLGNTNEKNPLKQIMNYINSTKSLYGVINSALASVNAYIASPDYGKAGYNPQLL